MDDNLTNFMAITGADANAAQFYVEAAGGNVELAVANFFDGGGGGGGGFGGGGFGGGGGSGAVGGGFDAMVDDVDAATSRDAEMARRSRPRTRARGRGGRVARAGPREAAAAPRRLRRGRRRRAAAAARGGRVRRLPRRRRRRRGGGAASSLATMFSPPTRLMHPGDFQAARAQGKAELKWLLVVITNEQVFGCHQMNRDVWADETVQAVVEASFVLWLRPHTDPAAVTYADRYDKDRAIPSPAPRARAAARAAAALRRRRGPRRRRGLRLRRAASAARGARGAAAAPAGPAPWADAVLSPEPAAGGVMVQFRLPNGAKKRRFEPSDTVAALFKFAAEASQTTGLFDLRCGFPPRQLWPQKDLTLEEAKVHGEAIQMKQG
ncbi:ubiquitin binding protein [Aureococcus anophagefferens]|nr:ubiquitin binding protein [Aureococcus anophagefferens]